MGDEETEGSYPGFAPLLDRDGFGYRLEAEVARVRRLGGFLSLAIVRAGAGAADAQEASERLAWHLRRKVRVHDILGRLEAGVVFLMPETAISDAVLALTRLLGAPLQDGASAGIAAVYGEVEGGAQALLSAAQEALDQAQPGQSCASASLDGRPRLLIVDDDRVFASTLAAMVAQRGWDAHTCLDPSEARQRVLSDTYSALFVDLVLPTFGGVQILREAIAHRPGRPAALMSSRDDDHASVLDALELGPVTFIRKPISPADLDAALHMFRSLLPGSGARRA